jgi:hypothetical protein
MINADSHTLPLTYQSLRRIGTPSLLMSGTPSASVGNMTVLHPSPSLSVASFDSPATSKVPSGGAALVVHLPGWAMDTLVRNDNPLAREKGQA